MADDLARLVDVEIVDGKGGQMLKYLAAHRFGNALGQTDHELRVDIGQSRRNDIKDQHQTAVEKYGREVDLTLSRFDGIDGGA